MRISDWSSDVCSSDLAVREQPAVQALGAARGGVGGQQHEWHGRKPGYDDANQPQAEAGVGQQPPGPAEAVRGHLLHCRSGSAAPAAAWDQRVSTSSRSSRNAYISASSRYLRKRPDLPPWPASMLVRSRIGWPPVSRSRSFATYLAGSQYCTCESHSPVPTNIAG